MMKAARASLEQGKVKRGEVVIDKTRIRIGTLNGFPPN